MAALKGGAFNIRQMTDDDIDEVMSLAQHTGRHRDMIGNDIRGRLGSSFVAEMHGRIIGFILAQTELLLVPLMEVCIIQAMAVDPDYRKLGVGALLVDELKNYCNVHQVFTLRALVPLHDTQLRKWVEKLGFDRSNIINYDKAF